MSRWKVLLLNPPGNQLYLRDYYCSKVSKGRYVYHPVDLLQLSGWLGKHFQLKVIDCIAEGISATAAIAMIKDWNPDAVVFVTGSVSSHEDYPFLEKVKKEVSCQLLGSGDCLLQNPSELHASLPWLDGIIVDFTTEDTANFLLNKFDGGNREHPLVIDLKAGSLIEVKDRQRGRTYDIPVPRHDLFPVQRYSYPFVRRRPFATVLTDYGCPYRCHFCVQSTIGFKSRTVENVLEELDLIAKLRIRDIYFSDQTFGYQRGRIEALCGAMIERNYNFNWVAFTRADCVNAERLRLMKRSGCHFLMFGVESASQRILDEQEKSVSLETIKGAFQLCKEVGIRTLATFVVGLPGSTVEDNLNILSFAKELDPHYASFNLAIPRINTRLREQAVNNGWILQKQMDQSGSYVSMRTDLLTEEQLISLQRSVIRGFYLRPSYFLRRLLDIRAPYELVSLVSNGVTLIANSFNDGRPPEFAVYE